MSPAPEIIDRRAVRHQRDRAARLGAGAPLLAEIADRLLDRLDDVRRRFPVALDLGCRDGLLDRRRRDRGGVETWIQADLSPAFARAAASRGPVLVADEECLPLAPASVDLVASNLLLHRCNDLPGALTLIRQALRPDGLFLASLFAGGTLDLLGRCLLEAETAVTGGAGPRTLPMIALHDAAALLQRAGFALPVADVDTIHVHYESPFHLMADLRAMAETNAAADRPRRPLRRDVLGRAVADYARRAATADGRVAARFQVVFLTGWAPAPGQPRPLVPGRADQSLAAVLGTEDDGHRC